MPAGRLQSRPGRPRDPSRDEAILDAAVELLVDEGFERMTVDGIAQRAGVGKPTIYRRWPGGKREVAIEALLRRGHKHSARDTGTLRGDLLAAVAQAGELLQRDALLASGIAPRLREDPEFAALVRDHVVAAERQRWLEIVERAIARGELPRRPATDVFADIAPSLLHGRIIFTGEPVNAAFGEELVDHVLLPVLFHTPTPTS